MNPRDALCFVLVLGLFFVACAKQETVSTGANSPGVYALVSVDGKEVPTEVSHGGVTLRVISGTFVIQPDGKCSSRTLFAPPGRDRVAREVAATYTREGSTLTLKWEGAGTTVGTIEGDTFTMDNEGMIFVYRR